MFDDTKITCAKNNCLTLSLVIIWLLLLVVIRVSYYFYYTKYCSKQKPLPLITISWHQQ